MGFLRVEGVSKTFGAVQVLHGVDISVEEGEFLVVVGPSGCGKSTLLNIIAGLDDVSGGTVWIRDRLMNGVHPANRNIAMVFQSYALYPNMTVAQNITFGLEMHGVPKPEREVAMRRVASMLQITELLDRRPRQLSGGQRQRVAMGRALVRNPDVFLFDEPLSNLDAKLRVTMRTEIKKLHQDLGVTIVYVTHDQVEAMTLATRIAVMRGGYLQQLGGPREIYDAPANLFVAGFMGAPSMNLIPARVRAHAGEIHAVLDAGGRDAVQLRLEQPGQGIARMVDREVILGIRPEAITDPESADRTARRLEHLRTEFVVVEPAGSDTFATCALGGVDCVCRLRADANVNPGDQFELAVNMDKAVLFDPASERRIA